MAVSLFTLFCILMPLYVSVAYYGSFPNNYVSRSDASLRICYLLWQFPNYYNLCSDASLQFCCLLWQSSQLLRFVF